MNWLWKSRTLKSRRDILPRTLLRLCMIGLPYFGLSLLLDRCLHSARTERMLQRPAIFLVFVLLPMVGAAADSGRLRRMRSV